MNELGRYYLGSIAGRDPVRAPAPVEDAVYYYADASENTHLRHYWNILLKRLRAIAAVFVDVMVLGVLVTLASPTLYTARSTLKIEPQNPTVTGVAGVGEALPNQSEVGPYDYYQTQFSLLKSEPLRARVIKKLNLEQNPAYTGDSGPNFFGAIAGWLSDGYESLKNSLAGLFGGAEPSPRANSQPAPYELGVPPWLVGRYANFLTVEPVRNTRLVDLIFNTPDAKLSQALANNHAASFIEFVLENRFSLTKEAKEFLGARLAELREKVQTAELKLNRFRQEHGVVSFDKGENIAVDRLVDINKALTKARADRIEAESVYRMTREKNTEYLGNVLGNPLIQQIKGSLANLEAEKGRLLSIFTPEHPRIQELNQQIQEARRGLRAEINNIVRGIESTYAAARAREDSLDKEAKTQQEAALSLKEVGVEYAVLNEEVVVNRGLYENVLKRLHETNVSNDLAASNIQIVQRAELPSVPSSPNWTRNMMVSAILGLVLAIAAAFFLEYMDSTVNTPERVWAAVSLTTLGIIPHLKSLPDRYRPTPLPDAPHNKKFNQLPDKSSDGMSKELVMVRDRISLTAESYRTIRTALLLSRAEHPPKVIMLTSPCSSEGKTVTTVNLGMALAQSGQKVLVVDADLRRGRCHKLVNISNQRGLANVLAGQVGLRAAIQETAVQNFYVLPRGGLPPNPADLLMSRKMNEVVDELRRSFDFVLIDTPPAIAVSDAGIVSALCDGVLLVFHGQKTSAHSARQAVERLDSIGAKLLGIILNGVDIRNPDYVDYRSYYPSYYAAMQAEAEWSARAASGWNGNGAAKEDVLYGAADLDRVIKNLGTDAARHGARERGRASEPNGVVRREFFDRMSAALSEGLGRRAFGAITDQVDYLRESIDRFPISRLWELTQALSREIVDPSVKARFLKTMSEEIRTLSH